jgi:hypothetical protein
VRLLRQRDTGLLRARGDLIDIVRRLYLVALADAFDAIQTFLAIVLTQAEARVTGFEHRAEEFPVHFPFVFDLEAETVEEIKALLQVVDRQARHHAPAAQQYGLRFGHEILHHDYRSVIDLIAPL